MITEDKDTLNASASHKIQPVGDVDKIKQILAALHGFIIEGDLQPGTELPSEKELAAALQVSRFSLREALAVARVQGLIEISRGRKPRVAEPSSAAATQIIALALRRSKNTLLDFADARLVLESHIAAEAAVRATDEDIDRLQETLDVSADPLSDESARIEKDFEFHSILRKASGNIVFEMMLAPLAGLLIESLKKNQRGGIGHEGHVAILEAIRQRNPAAAAAAMRKHLEFSRSMLEESLSQEGSETQE